MTIHNPLSLPMYNGIKCPVCTQELVDISGEPLPMTDPIEVQVECSSDECQFIGRRKGNVLC